MPDNLCKNFKDNIKLLRIHQDEFAALLTFILDQHDFHSPEVRQAIESIYSIKAEVEIIMEKFFSKYEIFVSQAVNPYFRVFKQGGIKDKVLNPEKGDIKIDLQEILTGDREAYAEIQQWHDALPENIADLQLSPKQLAVIRSRVKLGEIPIFMPGRLAQIEGVLLAAALLKPALIRKGKYESANIGPAYVCNEINKLSALMWQIAREPEMPDASKDMLCANIKALLQPGQDPMKVFEAVNNIPERPYVMMASPALDKKTVANYFDQIQIMEDIREKISKKDKRIKKEEIQPFSFGEYLALLQRYTQRAREQHPDLKELDYPKYESGVFIDQPLMQDPHSKGRSLSGHWFSAGPYFRLSEGGAQAKYAGIGFYYSIRINNTKT